AQDPLEESDDLGDRADSAIGGSLERKDEISGIRLSDEDTDDADDDSLAQMLGISLKSDYMSEEIIELGPTDNSDNLIIQRRQMKNVQEAAQHTRQVIEVKENHPPPCYINPQVDDPDAIVVKFNNELVLALDKKVPQASIQSHQPRKQRGASRRAVAKTYIEVPDPAKFALDYCNALSQTHNKYNMQIVSMAEEPVVKSKRGRKKFIGSRGSAIKRMTKGSAIFRGGGKSSKLFTDDMTDEEVDDPFDSYIDAPLLSDDELEEASAIVPPVKKTRSGRTVKVKKEDGTFSYYDMSSHGDAAEETESTILEESLPDKREQPVKYKRGRKRKNIDDEDDDPTFDLSKFNIRNIKSEKTVTDCVTKEMKGVKLKKETDQDVTDSTEKFLDFERSYQDMPDLGITNEIMENEPEDCTNIVVDEETGRSRVVTPPKMIDKIFDLGTPEHNKNLETLLDLNTPDSKNNKNLHKEESILLENVKVIDPSSDITGDSNGEISFHVSSRDNGKYNDDDFREETGSSTENFHECNVCGKQYQTRINLHAHFKKYHQDTEWMKFKCATCGRNFGFLSALERHMKEHNPNQKFCCEQCGKVFKSLVNLKNHIPLHTKDEVYECPYCPKQYYVKHSYDKHVKTHIVAPKFHCAICNKHFIEKKHFESHLVRHQTGGNLGRSKDFRCNNCGDMKSPSDLSIVGELDSGHHKTCLICGKGLYKKYMIENIGFTQAPPKEERQREQCKICGKWVLNLSRHVRYTHLENEYVPCDICNMVVTKNSLPAHKNRKHAAMPVTCDHCDRTFKNIMCLQEHMAKVRRREDPSKNVCKFCKVVVSLDKWKEHMAKHNKKCSDCGASDFPTQEEFLSHLESCQRCSNCGQSTFASRQEFLSHIEMCSSGIDIITSSLDSPSEQEVVTSIFAIVDENLCCQNCGDLFADEESLANHIMLEHPEDEALSGVELSVVSASSAAELLDSGILYACPADSCGGILTSEQQLKEHMQEHHQTIHSLELG
ncbi:unnamed protein product, partial [Meganyctiphanes norvegica]